MMVLLMCFATSITFAQNYKFGKVSKEELLEKVYAKDSTANAAYLHKEGRIHYTYSDSEGFIVVTEIRERIKIYNKEGFKKANINVSYYAPNSGSKERVSSIKGIVFNLNGERIEKTKLGKKGIFTEKLSKYRRVKKITMPNIKEGSVIELKYTIYSPYSNSIDDLQFQYNVPVKNLIYKVEIPEYLVFNKRVKGYLNIPMKENTRIGRIGSLTYTNNITEFKTTDIPALVDNEPYVNNINNYRAGVSFELTSTRYPNSMLKFFSTTWKDVTKTIYKSSSFGTELKKRSYFKDDLKKVLVAAKTASEKIVAIFDFVKSKVVWNEYIGIGTNKGVRKAYKEGAGNVAEINLMLTAMLKEAGLEAYPVILSTRANGVAIFPTIDGFNYVISAVKIQDKYILLDASDKYSTPNVLPLRVINWQGRIIKDDLSSDWISLQPSLYSGATNYLSVTLDDELELSGMYRGTYKNLRALNFRKSVNHVKEEEEINSLEESFGIEIDDYKLTNEKNIYKPVTRTIKFIGEDFVETINGKVYFSPLFFLKSTKNPFKLKERKFPVDYGVPIKNKTTVSIKIPKGYKVESLPEIKAMALSNGGIIFKFKAVVQGSKITVMSQLQINSPIIIPQFYQELKEFYNQMIKKQNEKIVLVKE